MYWVFGLVVFALAQAPVSSLKKGECEVCVSVLDRFKETLTSEEASVPASIEKSFRKFCKALKMKENRFCYFLGGTADAATGILGEMSKPMSWGMPSDKICELTYEKQIDFATVDLKKLKVKDLKKILSGWDEGCDGCLEKSDFIKRIEELKPLHVRTEL